MDKVLRPCRLEVLPNAPEAESVFEHWWATFNTFLAAVERSIPEERRSTEFDRRGILVNYLSHEVYAPLKNEDTYDKLTTALKASFEKKSRVVYARRKLATRMQKQNEDVIEFSRCLKMLAEDCGFKDVTAHEYKEEMMRDALVNGIQSNMIRQRLLEESDLTLAKAINIASSMEDALKHTSSFDRNVGTVAAAGTANSHKIGDQQCHASNSSDEVTSLRDDIHDLKESLAYMTTKPKEVDKCFFCAGSIHSRHNCPAKDSVCNYCGKKGHYKIACLARKRRVGTNRKRTGSSITASLCSASSAYHHNTVPNGLSAAVTNVKVCGKLIQALVDSGATDSFIRSCVAKELRLSLTGPSQKISLASQSRNSLGEGVCQTYNGS